MAISRSNTIAAITVTNLTETGTTIRWSTGIPADGQVFYGTSTNYGTATPLDLLVRAQLGADELLGGDGGGAGESEVLRPRVEEARRRALVRLGEEGAHTNAETPELMCTTVPPAKSRAPIPPIQPPTPHTQWHKGL